MGSVSIRLVREFFEQRGYLVMQPCKHSVTGRPKRPDEETDLVVMHPLRTEQRLPESVLWTADDVEGVSRAVVSVYAWHSERVYPALLENAPEIVRFAAPDAVRAAARRIGGGSPARVLCLPHLPVSAVLRGETLARLKHQGVDGVLPFRALLLDLLAGVEAGKNYEHSDLLQVLRILKNHDLLKEPQLELFGAGRGRARRARPRRASPPPIPGPEA